MLHSYIRSVTSHLTSDQFNKHLLHQHQLFPPAQTPDTILQTHEMLLPLTGNTKSQMQLWNWKLFLVSLSVHVAGFSPSMPWKQTPLIHSVFLALWKILEQDMKSSKHKCSYCLLKLKLLKIVNWRKNTISY